MARGLNKVMLIGNLGADPEIKYAASGTAIANIRLATAENRRTQDGNWEESTEWHRVVFFGKQAETCKDYLRKGSQIYIEGRIQARSWDDQSGQKRYSTEIVGNQFIMLGSRGQGQGAPSGGAPSGGGQQSGSRPQSNNQPAPPGGGFPEQDDDLPF